jgi:predicted TPR repeat methyltransferase
MVPKIESETVNLLTQAVQQHKHNNLAAAEKMYLRVLTLSPEHFDALHLLGLIHKQRGEFKQAVELIQCALRVDNQQAIAHCNLGATFAALGDHTSALVCYQNALRLQPRHAITWNNQGNALRSIGKFNEALDSFNQAIQIQNDYAEAFFNRGITRQEQINPSAALQDFENALRLRADYAEAHCARGAALLSLRQYAEALQSSNRALALKSAFPEASCNLGIAHFRLGDFSSALVSFDQAIALQAHYAKAHQYRANTLGRLERGAEAIVAYQTALACGGDVDQIQFALAALGATASPACAPAAYVAELFDHYADHFDQHLTENLAYTVPQQIVAAFAQQRRHLPEKIRIADVGCGTGLCAPYLKPYASHLAGVDLSPNMLRKASELRVYDELICAELVNYLSALRSEFGAIIAADVLVYIGDLSTTMQAAATALVAGGVFCFSTESSDMQNYQLQKSSRFAHHVDYITQLASDVGFEVKHSQRVPARKEGDAHLLIDIWVLAKKYATR